MSKQRCQRETTSTEFVEWQAFLDHEEKLADDRDDKIDWYLAQIAYEVLRANTRISIDTANHSRLKDFLLKFHRPVEITPEEQERIRKERLENAKLFFCMSLGTDTSVAFE